MPRRQLKLQTKREVQRMNKISSSLKKNRAYLLSLALSILAALIIGGILMAVTGYNPAEAYTAMIKGVFGSARVFGNTLAKMITLCLTGLAMAVCAKAGLFNVGGEGQLYFGGLAATVTGVCLHGVSPLIAVPLAFISAAAVGGIYALIPALLKVKLNVCEVITTIMLNSVAIYVCTYLVNSNGPLATDDKGVLGGSEAVPEAFMFSKLIPASNLSTALLYSAAIALLCWYVMQKTSIGLEMKVTGENERFSFFAGLPKDRLMIWSMVASGAICGLVGMFEVYGYQARFQGTISNEFYYDGMLVAMIMNYNPVGIIIMSFFFAVIDIGANAMELSTGVAGEISDIIFAIIIFLMAAQRGILSMLTLRMTQKKARKRIRKEAA